MPTQYCLALLELNGMGFSVAECEAQKRVMQAKLAALETRAYQLAGHSFSLTSPDDVAEVRANAMTFHLVIFIYNETECPNVSCQHFLGPVPGTEAPA